MGEEECLYSGWARQRDAEKGRPCSSDSRETQRECRERCGSRGLPEREVTIGFWAGARPREGERGGDEWTAAGFTLRALPAHRGCRSPIFMSSTCDQTSALRKSWERTQAMQLAVAYICKYLTATQPRRRRVYGSVRHGHGPPYGGGGGAPPDCHLLYRPPPWTTATTLMSRRSSHNQLCNPSPTPTVPIWAHQA